MIAWTDILYAYMTDIIYMKAISCLKELTFLRFLSSDLLWLQVCQLRAEMWQGIIDCKKRTHMHHIHDINPLVVARKFSQAIDWKTSNMRNAFLPLYKFKQCSMRQISCM